MRITSTEKEEGCADGFSKTETGLDNINGEIWSVETGVGTTIKQYQ